MARATVIGYVRGKEWEGGKERSRMRGREEGGRERRMERGMERGMEGERERGTDECHFRGLF